MDNACYHLGDTIYYKAYVLRTDSLFPTDMSEVLYAELYNQDGYLVERQMLRLHGGQAHGSFCLPDTIYAGYYELRAYTRWQLNWGARSHPHSRYARRWFLRTDMAEDYFRDYEKLYSRVFPIYDKCLSSESDYTQDMTQRPLRRYYRKKEREGKAMVNFYEAFNETVDAGLSPAWYAGSLSFTLNLARLYIGEMYGTDRAYDLERRWNGRDASFNIPQSELLKYNHLRNLHRVRIYTDYAPRLEGDPRYEASNQPSVTVSLDCLPDNMERTTYRDRRYLLTGYNVCEDFYQPHYETLPPEGYRDYRRTLYWNPDVQLDEDGRAVIRFYGNSRQTVPVVSVEGIADNGTLLSGRR